MKLINTKLEQELFDMIKEYTPDYVKNGKILDMTNHNEFVFNLKKEHLEPYNEQTNPEGLNLKKWLQNYAKEAAVSTAGIRGPQNILYPNDVRFPINSIGIMLATYAKALVAKEKYPNSKLVKIAGREVRYNSKTFLDIIARVQAAQGIETLTTVGRKSMPIWMASFLAFKLDLLGGEYITSSHGISVKNATKDLNSQGSQYLPEESIEFVDKIREIFDITEKEGTYEIKIGANHDKLINESYMGSINDGIELYREYLEGGVANADNRKCIKEDQKKIIIENVGGSAYRTLEKILKELNISDKYDWFNKDEDPFFHGIGKVDVDPKTGKKCFYDYSVDATVVATNDNGKPFFPVIETLDYEEKLKHYPLSTIVLITDPDHDRLTITQIEDKANLSDLEKAGIDYVELDDNRVLSVLTANQSFLLLMDFWARQLKESGLWDNHPRFIIKTTASAMAWDEWAKANGVNVVNVPVGFKEIANVMKKVEKQLIDKPDKDVTITDVFGNEINLGVDPRVIFAGEESGGMIIGPEKLIISKAGRVAIALREKSAAEAIVIASTLACTLEKEEKTLSKALWELFDKNKIIGRYDIREDISYYNESEPNIEKLTQSKIEGEAKRTKNDLFFLTLAIAKKEGKVDMKAIKEIFSATFKNLSFENLIDIRFVGDGTYLEFNDKFIEIRPSGTDAKTKAYGAGNNKEDILKYAQALGHYSGELNDKYLSLIEKDYYNKTKEKSLEYYQMFTDKDANNEVFMVPDYSKTLNLK